MQNLIDGSHMTEYGDDAVLAPCRALIEALAVR
jgi:hypothetical protein